MAGFSTDLVEIIPQMRVLYNKIPSQRNQPCSGEVVELGNSADSHQDGEGDLKSLWAPAVTARVITGISNRGEN